MALYYVSADANDYYINSGTGYVTGTTYIYAADNNAVIPNYTDFAYALVNTTGAPASIASANVSFTSTLYSVTGGKPLPTQIYHVDIFDGAGYVRLTNGTNVAWSSGTNTIALTVAEFAYINAVPGNTIFRIVVPDLGASKSRSMRITARELSITECIRMEIIEQAVLKTNSLSRMRRGTVRR